MALQTAESSLAPSPQNGSPQNGHAQNGYKERGEDPIVAILAAFYSLPEQYHADLFDSIRDAANSHDLRHLLDAISDWAATAQLYANPDLAADLTEAIESRVEVSDWLTG